MNLRLFDLHCDTALEIFKQKQNINSNNCLHISLDKSDAFSVYTQVFAVFSKPGCDYEKLWKQFFSVKSYLEKQIPKKRCETEGDCDPDFGSGEAGGTRGGFTYILAMEGGSPINGDLKRLDKLYKAGVRILTPVWRGCDEIGGAYDTGEGLKDYGRSLIRRCLEIGIMPDVSHASDRMTSEIIELCEEYGKPAIASHSNSRSVYSHPRNITDENFKALVSTGGIAGINLEPSQMSQSGGSVEYAAAHIERFLELGGERCVALGCDFDGIDSLPRGIQGIGDLYKLADKLGQYNYPDKLVDGIFYANGRNYFDCLLN